MKYQTEVELFLNKQEKYISNMNRVNALVYGQCSKALQHKLQTIKDFQSTIKTNAIELLKRIEELSGDKA